MCCVALPEHVLPSRALRRAGPALPVAFMRAFFESVCSLWATFGVEGAHAALARHLESAVAGQVHASLAPFEAAARAAYAVGIVNTLGRLECHTLHAGCRVARNAFVVCDVCAWLPVHAVGALPIHAGSIDAVRVFRATVAAASIVLGGHVASVSVGTVLARNARPVGRLGAGNQPAHAGDASAGVGPECAGGYFSRCVERAWPADEEPIRDG